jgi:hypothetical protein
MGILLQLPLLVSDEFIAKGGHTILLMELKRDLNPHLNSTQEFCDSLKDAVVGSTGMNGTEHALDIELRSVMINVLRKLNMGSTMLSTELVITLKAS